MAKKSLTQYFKDRALEMKNDNRNFSIKLSDFRDHSGRKLYDIFIDVIKEELVKAYNGFTINLEYKDIHKALSTVVDAVKTAWDEEMISKITFADYVKNICRAETIKFIIPGLIVDSYIWLTNSERITERDCKELSTSDDASIYYIEIVNEIKDRYGLCKEENKSENSEYIPVEMAVLITGDSNTYIFNKDNMHMYESIENKVNVKHSIYIFKDSNGELSTLCNTYHKYDDGVLYVKVNTQNINKNMGGCVIVNENTDILTHYISPATHTPHQQFNYGIIYGLEIPSIHVSSFASGIGSGLRLNPTVEHRLNMSKHFRYNENR